MRCNPGRGDGSSRIHLLKHLMGNTMNSESRIEKAEKEVDACLNYGGVFHNCSGLTSYIA